MDKQQCKQDWELALAACDRDKRAGNLACDAAYQPGLDACIQAVYQRCGTSSPYHTCVITGRQQCVSDAAATLQGSTPSQTMTIGPDATYWWQSPMTDNLHVSAGNRFTGWDVDFFRSDNGTPCTVLGARK